MSLWGRKNDHKSTGPPHTPNGEEHRHAPDAPDAPEQRFEEPTERSRLLPADRNEGFLSPDDPAVSPINKTILNSTPKTSYS